MREADKLQKKFIRLVSEREDWRNYGKFPNQPQVEYQKQKEEDRLKRLE